MASNPSRFDHYRSVIEKAQTLEELKLALVNPMRNLRNFQNQMFTFIPQLLVTHEDTPLQQTGGNIATPPACKFFGSHSGGIVFIEIIDPQDVKALTAQLRSLLTNSNQNAPLVPIVHQLRSATSSSFDAASNLKLYQRVANHFSKPDANTFWQLQSSYDGQNFNAWSAAKVIP